MSDFNNVVSQLHSVGLLVDHPLINEFRRCKVEGDKGSKQSGWYIIHEYMARNGRTYYSGMYGNWKLHGGEGVKIRQESTGLDDFEREQMKKRQRECLAAVRAEKLARNEDAAKRAAKVWASLPGDGPSEYLARKKVPAYGVKFSRGSVIVPVRSATGDLVGLQFIDGQGCKKFLTGTAKSGAFHLIGEVVPSRPLVICEGYATGASIHCATGWPVVIAFDAENLIPVAKAVRQLHPEADIIVAGDNDVATPGNPGMTKATTAANAVGAVVVVPAFVEAVSC
jgi:putative DNA primase/helicase